MIAPAPCPNCGSTNVQWRRRTRLDSIRTYLRHTADNVVGSLLGARKTASPIAGYSERSDELRAEAKQYDVERKLYENRVGTVTADQFWKCKQCGKHGEVFDNVEDLVAGRQRLTDLEHDISDNLGTVIAPIGTEEVPKD